MVCCTKEGHFMAASVWKGHLTFGLVTIPVRPFRAARSETISFNMLHKDAHSRIRQVTVCQAEDKPVSRNELVKGYEYEKDHYVVIEEEDIKKVAPKTAKVMEILEFVHADQVDPIYLESCYYMAPDEGGEKAYALLFEALRQSKFYALAKVAMHNREHIIVLSPGAQGILSPDKGVRAGSEQMLAQTKLSPADIGLIIHGTTLATNAIIERKGARTAMIV